MRPKRDLHVGLVERFRSADALDVLGRLRLRDVEHVVDGDDADEHAGGVGDRQRRAILARGTRATAVSWSSVAFSATKRRSIRSATRAGRRGQQELADADVVDQQALVVDDVDDVQRLAVLAVRRGCSRAPARRSSPRAPRRSAASSAGRSMPSRIAEQRRRRRRAPPGVSSASSCRVALAGSSSRNIVRSSGAMSLSSAATSSCAIALSSAPARRATDTRTSGRASLRGRRRKTTTWSSTDT